ncbi:hypothetical protein Y1Q_0005050 [Alligator mississippiensis]|uniref:Uncharacterized protein n=1 Tax=Alligator mississippiensis TaxID=8496 RepID=A0A151MPK5_ALLMI|nr:hypothetical protein Y1Q_0005050 [Alligator mississippiensis]
MQDVTRATVELQDLLVAKMKALNAVQEKNLSLQSEITLLKSMTEGEEGPPDVRGPQVENQCLRRRKGYQKDCIYTQLAHPQHYQPFYP